MNPDTPARVVTYFGVPENMPALFGTRKFTMRYSHGMKYELPTLCMQTEKRAAPNTKREKKATPKTTKREKNVPTEPTPLTVVSWLPGPLAYTSPGDIRVLSPPVRVKTGLDISHASMEDLVDILEGYERIRFPNGEAPADVWKLFRSMYLNDERAKPGPTRTLGTPLLLEVCGVTQWPSHQFTKIGEVQTSDQSAEKRFSLWCTIMWAFFRRKILVRTAAAVERVGTPAELLLVHSPDMRQPKKDTTVAHIAFYRENVFNTPKVHAPPPRPPKAQRTPLSHDDVGRIPLFDENSIRPGGYQHESFLRCAKAQPQNIMGPCMEVFHARINSKEVRELTIQALRAAAENTFVPEEVDEPETSVAPAASAPVIVPPESERVRDFVMRVAKQPLSHFIYVMSVCAECNAVQVPSNYSDYLMGLRFMMVELQGEDEVPMRIETLVTGEQERARAKAKQLRGPSARKQHKQPRSTPKESGQTSCRAVEFDYARIAHDIRMRYKVVNQKHRRYVRAFMNPFVRLYGPSQPYNVSTSYGYADQTMELIEAKIQRKHHYLVQRARTPFASAIDPVTIHPLHLGRLLATLPVVEEEEDGVITRRSFMLQDPPVTLRTAKLRTTDRLGLLDKGLSHAKAYHTDTAIGRAYVHALLEQPHDEKKAEDWQNDVEVTFYFLHHLFRKEIAKGGRGEDTTPLDEHCTFDPTDVPTLDFLQRCMQTELYAYLAPPRTALGIMTNDDNGWLVPVPKCLRGKPAEWARRKRAIGQLLKQHLQHANPDVAEIFNDAHARIVPLFMGRAQKKKKPRLRRFVGFLTVELVCRYIGPSFVCRHHPVMPETQRTPPTQVLLTYGRQAVRQARRQLSALDLDASHVLSGYCNATGDEKISMKLAMFTLVTCIADAPRQWHNDARTIWTRMLQIDDELAMVQAPGGMIYNDHDYFMGEEEPMLLHAPIESVAIDMSDGKLKLDDVLTNPAVIGNDETNPCESGQLDRIMTNVMDSCPRVDPNKFAVSVPDMSPYAEDLVTDYVPCACDNDDDDDDAYTWAVDRKRGMDEGGGRMGDPCTWPLATPMFSPPPPLKRRRLENENASMRPTSMN